MHDERAGDKLRELRHYLFVCAHERLEAYGKIQPRFPRADAGRCQHRTVSRLQGYPVSRASEPRELPYGAYPMPRTRKDRQGLPVVNGRRSFRRPVFHPRDIEIPMGPRAQAKRDLKLEEKSGSPRV